MKYYGIKTPDTENEKSYIWWISNSEFNSWMMFFTQPNKDDIKNAHRSPIYEARKAYEAIGYKCVELKVEEV